MWCEQQGDATFGAALSVPYIPYIFHNTAQKARYIATYGLSLEYISLTERNDHRAVSKSPGWCSNRSQPVAWASTCGRCPCVISLQMENIVASNIRNSDARSLSGITLILLSSHRLLASYSWLESGSGFRSFQASIPALLLRSLTVPLPQESRAHYNTCFDE